MYSTRQSEAEDKDKGRPPSLSQGVERYRFDGALFGAWYVWMQR